jgi:zinc protease
MKKTVAALPPRSSQPVPPVSRAVRPPQPSPTPKVFTHEGDPSQAFATIGWNTFGGIDRRKERRALSLAGNILQARLFERLREAEGASYSPSAISSTSEELPEWGVFYAAAELKPESTGTFLRIAREIVAELAAKPVSAEEFERAKNPVLTGIDRRVKTNGYWMTTLEDWSRQPEMVDLARTFRSDYAAMTAEDVRAAVAAHVADAGDWSMLVLPAKKAGGGK